VVKRDGDVPVLLMFSLAPLPLLFRVRGVKVAKPSLVPVIGRRVDSTRIVLQRQRADLDRDAKFLDPPSSFSNTALTLPQISQNRARPTRADPKVHPIQLPSA
jgi:hypothetical protein